MIVVAIIAILAAIAIPAYNQYIKEAQMSKVSSHYDEAYRSVKAEMAKIVAIQARGAADTDYIDINDANDWISDVINPEDRTAPKSSDPAYADGTGDGDSGQVGITAALGIVTITQPAFIDLNESNVTVDFADM